MTYPSYAQGYSGEDTVAFVQGETAGLFTEAPAGDVSASTEVVAPPAGAQWTADAPPGRVRATSNVALNVLLAGETATVVLAAPRGAVSGSFGDGLDMPQGEPATVAVTAPAGTVSVREATGGGGGATGAVFGAVATLVVEAPAGEVRGSIVGGLAGPVVTITVVAHPGDVSALTVNRTADVLTLELLDVEVPTQPGVVRARIFNGVAGDTVYVFLDNATVGIEVVLAQDGSTLVSVPVDDVPLGTHTVRVGTLSTPPATTAFNQRSFEVTGEPAPPEVFFTPAPVARTAVVNRWVFQHVRTAEAYTLPRNPERSSKVFGGFTYRSEPTTNGGLIEWEGAPTPQPLTFTGRIFTESEYREMQKWLTLGRFFLTDHLGLRYLVVGATFTTRRVRDRLRPWHHTYEVRVDVLAGDGVLT